MANRPEDLMNAASEGRLDLLKQLVATDNINVLDWRGCALPAAIKNGHIDVVTYLLHRGATPGVSINIASSIGSVQMVKLLLNHEASVGDRDYEGKTPLHCACEGGHLEVVQLLLANGAQVAAKDISGRTPLHLASRNGELDVVATLIRKGASVNTKDRGGNNSLHRACEGGNTAVVEELLKHKTSSHARNHRDMIPLHSVCEVGNTEVVAILMARSKYSRQQLNKALLLAIEQGFHETVQVLLTNGASIRINENLLYFACLNHKLEVVNVLLAHGADTHERIPPNGATPLHIACRIDNSDIVESLLQHGADVFNKDYAGRIPLHYTRSGKVLRVLMQMDIDVNTKDMRGNTTLVYASEHSHELCCSLLDYGAGAGLKCRKLGCLRENTGMMCYYKFCRNNVKCNCRTTGEQCPDNSSHKNVYLVDSFEKYFIKLKTARIIINENEKAVEPPIEGVDWPEPQRAAQTTFCTLELEKMKILKIKNTIITYFDLLTRNLFDLQDEAILGNFDVNKCVEDFPIYGYMIHNRYLDFRKAFLKEHSRTFFGLTVPWLPLECAERVIDYLSNRDLDNLVLLCQT